MADKECPTQIEAAAKAYYEALGGENYQPTSTGAVADLNFSRMTAFTNKLTAAITANPGKDVDVLAKEIFAKEFPQGDYRQLGDGKIADFGFSMQNQFSNELSAHLGAQAACESMKR